MIVITNVIIHGKGATKWFKRMADYFNQRQPSINARVMKPMSGNMAELMLVRIPVKPSSDSGGKLPLPVRGESSPCRE